MSSGTKVIGVVLLLGAALRAQAPATPVARGLAVPQALGLRSVANPRLGVDFAAFTLLVPRPLADGPGVARQHVGVIDGLAAVRKLPAGTLPAVRWLVAGKDTAPAMQVRTGHREVSFLRAVDGVPQVFVQSIDAEAAQAWTPTPAVSAYRWRPDGKALAFTSLEPLPAARAAAQARGFQPVVVDEEARHLSLWVVEQGGVPRQLTRDVTVFGFEWAPDGQRLACAVAPKNTVDDEMMFQRLHVLDVGTGTLAKLVDNPGKLGNFTWSPDGAKLAYITAVDRNDPHAGALAFVDVATGAARVWPRRFVQGMFSDVCWPGNTPLAIDHNGVHSEVRPRADLPFNLSGVSVFPHDDGQITAFTASPDAMVAAIGTAVHPPELFLDGGRRLTNSNPDLAGVELGRQTVVKIRARDGLELEGMLLLPVGYETGRRHPFVIVVHGGPEAHFSNGWLTSYSNWGQLLAARGYVSWYPNYRSSTGYGAAFAKHDHGDPMGKEFTDHLDAIEHFAAIGLIDKARVGIGGGSYGGYTAAFAATRHTEHFAAAVSFVPFVDLRTKWLTSDIPNEFYFVHYQEQWPWQQPGLMADRSPLTWAERCRTPLLLLGGTSDPRVHPSQPFLLHRAVKLATTTPVRYVQYPGEGHGNRTNVYQHDYALRTLQWFDHYLLGDGDRRTKPLPPQDLDYPK